jgi:hypothetical protein
MSCIPKGWGHCFWSSLRRMLTQKQSQWPQSLPYPRHDPIEGFRIHDMLGWLAPFLRTTHHQLEKQAEVAITARKQEANNHVLDASRNLSKECAATPPSSSRKRRSSRSWIFSRAVVKFRNVRPYWSVQSWRWRSYPLKVCRPTRAY